MVYYEMLHQYEWSYYTEEQFRHMKFMGINLFTSWTPYLDQSTNMSICSSTDSCLELTSPLERTMWNRNLSLKTLHDSAL